MIPLVLAWMLAAVPSPLDRLLIKDACADQLLLYAAGLDATDPAAIAGVFAERATWSADGGKPIEGKAALRTLWNGIAARKRATVGIHAVSSIRFAVRDGDAADGTAIITQHRYDPAQARAVPTLAPTMVNRVAVRCVRTPEGWRFDRMELRSASAADYTHGKD
ncbi:MAG: SnoaL-like domain [Sphingomonas bacterium]|nr:SnoaL-like domain [Sphingomonas bacterium]MDB5682857.1 SnoaL-like domain [Sphingomonas bacterium]MDB5717455.1 SnoaL-like domain [Sphingomonas bacterium]